MGFKLDRNSERRHKKVMDKLQNFPKEEIPRFMRSFTRQATNLSKSKAPVDTGELKRSITGKNTDKSATITVNADHGAAVEFGTRHTAPKPFFFGTMRRTANKIADKIKKRLRKP